MKDTRDKMTKAFKSAKKQLERKVNFIWTDKMMYTKQATKGVSNNA